MLKNRELLYALIAMLFIALLYSLVQSSTREVPSASSLWGHSLGVLGFILMVMTESLYSFRKRSKRGARWGKMSSWLEFHIFTGIVGPFMVLLHPGWQFQGLAGARRLFSLWHTIHIPLGLTLFMVALVHIGAVIYYSMLIY
jgi:hypothetical protein